MWEEQPEYQKHQAKMIGILALLVFVTYIGYSIKEKDWSLLQSIIEFAGVFIAVMTVLPICAWLIVKLFKFVGNKRNSSPNKDHSV